MDKKTTDKKTCCGKSAEKPNNVVSEIHKVGDEIMDMINKAKDKYAKTDPKTKQAIMAGVAGAAALIAGAIGYKKVKGKK
jgi:hypothetical protein